MTPSDIGVTFDSSNVLFNTNAFGNAGFIIGGNLNEDNNAGSIFSGDTDIYLEYDDSGSLIRAFCSTSANNQAIGTPIAFSGSYAIRELPMSGSIPEAASSLTWLGLLAMAAIKRQRSA